MRKIIPLIFVVLITFIISISCGDETTIINYTADSLWDTTYTNITGKWAIDGTIYLSPHLHFDGRIFSDENVPVEPDSITVGDNKIEFFKTNSWRQGYFVYEIQYDNELDRRYSAGDTVTIEFFTGEEIGHCNIVVIDNTYLTNFAVPIPDTIAPGGSLSVTWNIVPFSDWYLFHLWGSRDSIGTEVSVSYDTILMDTTIMIPQQYLQSDAELYIVVLGYSGPHPDDTIGNVFGNLTRGTILSRNSSVKSHGGNYHGKELIVGNGLPVSPNEPPEIYIPIINSRAGN